MESRGCKGMHAPLLTGRVRQVCLPRPELSKRLASLPSALLQPADAPLVSSEVLVETFEEGELISK